MASFSDPPIEVGAGVILRRDDRILVSRRKEGDSFGGFWEFPGGKKRWNEALKACVEREVWEETGIRILAQTPLLRTRTSIGNRRIELHFFLCQYLEGEPSPIECAEVLWAGVEELKGRRFPPSNAGILDLLDRHGAEGLRNLAVKTPTEESLD